MAMQGMHDDSPQPIHKAMGVTEIESLIEVIGGLGGVVLGILGLAGVMPTLFVELGAIAVGLGLLAQAGAIGTQYLTLATESEQAAAGLSGGVSAVFIGGLGGAILGLLALLGLSSILTAVAVIAFGAVLLRGMGATTHLNSLLIADAGTNAFSRTMALELVSTAAGFQILAGLGGIALGILALVGIAPTVLVLVALLSLGAATLLGSSGIIRQTIGIIR